MPSRPSSLDGGLKSPHKPWCDGPDRSGPAAAQRIVEHELEIVAAGGRIAAAGEPALIDKGRPQGRGRKAAIPEAGKKCDHREEEDRVGSFHSSFLWL